METPTERNSTLLSSQPKDPTTPPGYHRPTKRKSTKASTRNPFDEIPALDRTRPSTNLSNESSNEPPDTVFTKLITSPLFFISFILSLFYIDRRNRSYRLAHQSSFPALPPDSSLWSRLTFRLNSWWDPEPYQDPSDSTWKVSDEAGTSEHGNVPVPERGGTKGREKWVTRKKHRKMAKMELTDAFDMVYRVETYVVGLFIVGIGGVGWVIMKLWGRFW